MQFYFYPRLIGLFLILDYFLISKRISSVQVFLHPGKQKRVKTDNNLFFFGGEKGKKGRKA